jgi:predicted esterase YcpF (UPF0227 family)
VGFGLTLAATWLGANEAAKTVAATIAVGAKAVGQVPVIMAWKENTETSLIQGAREIVTKTAVSVRKTVDVTQSEWIGWMDVKAAKVLQDAGLPVDAVAESRQAALDNIAAKQEWEQRQAASNAALGSMRDKVNQANAQRSAASQELKQKIVAGGRAAADAIDNARKYVDALAVKGLVRTVYGAIHLFTKSPVNSPVTSCTLNEIAAKLRAQIVSQEALLSDSCGPTAATLKLEKQIDVSKKALLAEDAYEEPNGPDVVPGYHRLGDDEIKALGLDPNDFHPDGSQFRAAIYKCGDRYTVAYKGTDPSKEQDLENDALQHFGLPSDYYERAQQLAKIVNRRVGPNLDFTGHSLGGGLATAAVASLHDTRIRAVVFNPSALNPDTVPDADLAQVARQIDVYQVEGEVLTTLQADASTVGLSPKVVGEQHAALPAREGDNWIERHKMPAVERGLLKQGEGAVASP